MPSPSSRPPPLLLALLLSTVSSALAQEPCYWRSNEAIAVQDYPGWFACNNTNLSPNGAQLCCLGGAQCGDDRLCRSPMTNGSTGYGYFVGGCTDPNYRDPVCRMECTGDSQTWIQWDNSVSAWRCCGDDGCDGSPTTETFQASPPQRFVAVASAMSTTSSTASATSSSRPASSSSSSSASASPTLTDTGSGGGLSSGAVAGIAVAGAVVGLALVGAVLWFCWRRRKADRKQNQAAPEASWQQQDSPHQYMATPQSQGYDYYPEEGARKEAPMPPSEMPVEGHSRAELGGDTAVRKK
ncbi:hypothetical protein LTR37_002141 [Vermiconidia calcicola]|uniref:Uncharacterized protein n=1 Tax=Vermiconidia calcicola TaxID=1690605 RepID=A0ACC3NTT4_9PEZI|nr:hypothetical protein LTR37_002141 [Vermiconidia calcicola]